MSSKMLNLACFILYITNSAYWQLEKVILDK